MRECCLLQEWDFDLHLSPHPKQKGKIFQNIKKQQIIQGFASKLLFDQKTNVTKLKDDFIVQCFKLKIN